MKTNRKRTSLLQVVMLTGVLMVGVIAYVGLVLIDAQSPPLAKP